jgi:hypothetical protein
MTKALTGTSPAQIQPLDVMNKIVSRTEIPNNPSAAKKGISRIALEETPLSFLEGAV